MPLPAASPQPTAPSITDGQDFIPSGAVTGGQMSQNPISETPANQDDSQVTPEEQKQYDDLVTRCLLFINDPRAPIGKNGHPQPNGKAPRDVIIEHLNSVGDQAAEQAVGRTTAQVMTLVTNNAKHQGFPYPPDVIFHGAKEVIDALYKIGVASGVIKNPPAAGSPEEDKLMGMAMSYAAQFFGQNLIDSGQNPPELQDEAKQYMLDQIHREGQSGQLDKWTPSQSVAPEKLTSFIHRAATGQAQAQGRAPPPSTISDYAGRGHPQLVPPGGAASPPDEGAPAPGGP